MADKRNILLLFDRPQEPVALIKGQKKAVQFNVPRSYLNDEIQPYANVITLRNEQDADEQVNVNQISIPPLGQILELPRDDAFSIFLPKHRDLAAKLIDIFMGVRNADDLLAVAIYARERVNPYLFQYALTVALLHRTDTRELDVPSIVHSFPDRFIENGAIGKARELATIVPEMLRTPIEIPKDFTASDLEEEHRLAYFREDIALNLHHWHWHLVYPVRGPMEIVNKNRRGELFYYMHQQIVARYDFERLCNNMKRVERLIDWDAPIKEAYFPKLDRIITSRAYPFRVANQKLQNLRREIEGAGAVAVDVDDLKRWRDNILTAISAGFVKDRNNKDVPLGEFDGIDILGNIVEACDLSINQPLYGNLHNQGHNMIAHIHDPDGRNLEKNGVMGDQSTAMRDPIFYRWHAFIDDMFHKFKDSLPRYTESQLHYPGVEVEDIQVTTKGKGPNTLSTFWQQSDVDIASGLDFQPRGALFVRFTHLQNAEFVYDITVNNKTSGQKEGTCRIFLAPKFDERANPWTFNSQKNMFIELDKFKVTLKQGKNTIMRASTQSSVTIPFEQTFRDFSIVPEGQQEQVNFCGCGWPQNLLIPKGKVDGMPCQLFCMISDYAEDKIEQDTHGLCNDAYSYCGIKDKLYPDRRSMGYPFDRQAREGVDTLQQFLTPNMRVRDISIHFENKTFRKPKA